LSICWAQFGCLRRSITSPCGGLAVLVVARPLDSRFVGFIFIDDRASTVVDAKLVELRSSFKITVGKFLYFVQVVEFSRLVEHLCDDGESFFTITVQYFRRGVTLVHEGDLPG